MENSSIFKTKAAPDRILQFRRHIKKEYFSFPILTEVVGFVGFFYMYLKQQIKLLAYI